MKRTMPPVSRGTNTMYIFTGIYEAFSLAWSGIFSNKFRSFLTMLGMIIGVGSVIAMVSIGEGAQYAVLKQYERFGMNTFTLSGGNARMRINMEVIDYIMESCPSLSGNYLMYTFGSTLKGSKEQYTIAGTMPGLAVARNWTPAVGSFITQEHMDSYKKVIVLGRTLCRELYGEEIPIGEYLRIGSDMFEIVGVMNELGMSISTDLDIRAFIPMTTRMRLPGSSTYLSSIAFVVHSNAENKEAIEEVKTALYRRWGDAANEDNTFRYTMTEDAFTAANSTVMIFTVVLAAIAGIFLLVGGIGIMNIMLVSVTERTREIGIRRALGARYRDLLFQFLIEATIISLTGGILGIGIGILGANAVAIYFNWGWIISIQAIIMAFAFSVGIGLLFGVYPASRAARMDPIQALRHQ